MSIATATRTPSSSPEGDARLKKPAGRKRSPPGPSARTAYTGRRPSARLRLRTLLPVTSHDFTHKASALLDPVVFHDPNAHTGGRLLGCHTLGAPFLVLIQATIKLERRSSLCSGALSTPEHSPGGSWSVLWFCTEPVRSSPPPICSGPASHIPDWHTLVLKCSRGCHETQGAPRH